MVATVVALSLIRTAAAVDAVSQVAPRRLANSATTHQVIQSLVMAIRARMRPVVMATVMPLAARLFPLAVRIAQFVVMEVVQVVRQALAVHRIAVVVAATVPAEVMKRYAAAHRIVAPVQDVVQVSIAIIRVRLKMSTAGLVELHARTARLRARYAVMVSV